MRAHVNEFHIGLYQITNVNAAQNRVYLWSCLWTRSLQSRERLCQ